MVIPLRRVIALLPCTGMTLALKAHPLRRSRSDVALPDRRSSAKGSSCDSAATVRNAKTMRIKADGAAVITAGRCGSSLHALHAGGADV